MKVAHGLIRPNRLSLFIQCYFVEVMLGICSASLALRLFAYPLRAEQCVIGHPHVIAIIEQRAFWGTAAAIACVLKIVGLICVACRKYWQVSAVLRFLGLFMSSVMWSILGLSYMVDCPYEIAGIQMLLMGLSAGALKWTMNMPRSVC